MSFFFPYIWPEAKKNAYLVSFPQRVSATQKSTPEPPLGDKSQLPPRFDSYLTLVYLMYYTKYIESY